MTAVFVLVVVAIIAFFFSKNISAFFYRKMNKAEPSPLSSSNFQIAQKFELKKDYDRAITAYTHLIEEFPDFDAAYISIAEIYKKRKEYENAILWLNKLYERNKSVDTLYLICEMYMAKGEIEKVEEILKNHYSELSEFQPIIDSYIKYKRDNDQDAYTYIKILAGSEDIKDYIRLKAKRVLSYL
ncbi:MAG: tetratricopeptide repeat protein [Myxococcota bacterium]